MNLTTQFTFADFGEPSLSDAQKRSLIFGRESGAIDNHVCRQINGPDTLAASQELRWACWR